MSSITPAGSAAIACFRVSGTALPQQERVQTFGIVGVDGVGVHLLGNFGQPSNWTVKQYGSHSALQTWFDLVSVLIGQVCTLINDEGQNYPNQLVESVGQPQKQTGHDGLGATELWTVSVVTRTV